MQRYNVTDILNGSGTPYVITMPSGMKLNRIHDWLKQNSSRSRLEYVGDWYLYVPNQQDLMAFKLVFG